MADLEDALAKNLRRLRNEAGWTQEDLAAQVDLSARYIGSIERGRVSATLDVLARLAKALGVGPADLIHRA